jgi:hypothetical protein
VSRASTEVRIQLFFISYDFLSCEAAVALRHIQPSQMQIAGHSEEIEKSGVVEEE